MVMGRWLFQLSLLLIGLGVEQRKLTEGEDKREQKPIQSFRRLGNSHILPDVPDLSTRLGVHVKPMTESPGDGRLCGDPNFQPACVQARSAMLSVGDLQCS